MSTSRHALRLGVLLAGALAAGVMARAAGKTTVYQYDARGNLTAVIDTLTDANHCGSLGHVCQDPNGSSPQCVGGACRFQCNSGYTLCGESCRVLATDPSNCGTCGRVCSYTHASAVCSGGSCQLGSCAVGYGNCDGNQGNGCEASLSSPSSCGTCGRVCSGVTNGYATCSSGTCGLACNSGYANCDGSAANGCEIYTQNDVNNCGACGHVCPGVANGYATCSNGTCGLACNAGYTLCSGQCRALASDVNNCGACGRVCNLPHATATCTSGTCQIASCNTNYGNCNGNAADGCETYLFNNSANCGGCGRRCNDPWYCNGTGCRNPDGDGNSVTPASPP